MLDNIFEKLELRKIHANIYINLLEDGPLPAGNLAKKLAVPRSTLYGFLGDLTAKGLVLQSEKQKVKLWQATSPEKVSEIINEKINFLEDAKTNFDKIMPKLKSSQKTDFVSPKFSYFDGADGIKQIMKDILLYRNIETETFWPIKDMLEIIGQAFLSSHNQRRIKNNMSIRAIWPKEKAVDIRKNIFLGVGGRFKREIRIAPKEVDFSMGYWAYSDKVAFISSKKESFGFIVQSKEFRQLLKTQFNILWDISKPIKVDSKYTDPFLENINKLFAPQAVAGKMK